MAPRGISAGDRVLVTGAAGGFGAPTLRRLLERAVHVVGLDDAVPQDDAEHLIACDLTDDAAVDAAVTAATERLGRIDAVVHFAGTKNDREARAGLAGPRVRAVPARAGHHRGPTESSGERHT